jgi:hypothetical protein
MDGLYLQQVPPQPVPGDLPNPPDPRPVVPPRPVTEPGQDPTQVPPPVQDPDVVDPLPSPDAPPLVAYAFP